MSSVVVTAAWPVVVLVCPPRLDAKFVEDLDRAFGEIFARNEPFALITVTAAVQSIPDARERKLLTQWTSRPDQLALQKRLNVGSSTIIKSALMRGTLQALYWLWTPPAPQHAAKDFDEAWQWCASLLASRNVTLPGDAAALRRAAEAEISRLHVRTTGSPITPS